MPDEPVSPYPESLSMPTLMGLLASYTAMILHTNAMGDDVAYANGCTWDDAFVFRLPHAALLAEVNRMASWCAQFRAEVDAALMDDLLKEAEAGPHAN